MLLFFSEIISRYRVINGN